MSDRDALIRTLAEQRSIRDRQEPDTLMWAWHCGACYALAIAAGVDPNGPLPDPPSPETGVSQIKGELT